MNRAPQKASRCGGSVTGRLMLGALAAEAACMTIAPNSTALAVAPAVAADVTALLPQREAVLDRPWRSGCRPPARSRLDAASSSGCCAATTAGRPRSRRWPLGDVAPRPVAARRRLAGQRPGDGVRDRARRRARTPRRPPRPAWCTAVGASVPDMAAAAGIAPLAVGLGAGEVLRRATLSLTEARRLGGHASSGTANRSNRRRRRARRGPVRRTDQPAGPENSRTRRNPDELHNRRDRSLKAATAARRRVGPETARRRSAAPPAAAPWPGPGSADRGASPMPTSQSARQRLLLPRHPRLGRRSRRIRRRRRPASSG